MDILPSAEGGESKPLSNGAATRIASIAEQVKSKHGGGRAGAGRKPGASSVPRPVGPSPTKNQAEAETPPSEADLDFVQETAKSALTLLSKFLSTKVYDAVTDCDFNLEKEAQRFSEGVEITEPEVELVSKATRAVACKYSVLARFAPEMMLVGWMTTYGLRVSTVLKEVRTLTLTVKAMKAKNHAGTPQTD